MSKTKAQIVGELIGKGSITTEEAGTLLLQDVRTEYVYYPYPQQYPLFPGWQINTPTFTTTCNQTAEVTYYDGKS